MSSDKGRKTLPMYTFITKVLFPHSNEEDDSVYIHRWFFSPFIVTSSFRNILLKYILTQVFYLATLEKNPLLS